MAHNTAHYPSKAFAEIIRFNSGGFLVDDFYYFDNGTKTRHYWKNIFTFVIKGTKKFSSSDLLVGGAKSCVLNMCWSSIPVKGAILPANQNLGAIHSSADSNSTFLTLTEIYLIFL